VLGLALGQFEAALNGAGVTKGGNRGDSAEAPDRKGKRDGEREGKWSQEGWSLEPEESVLGYG
jgi:hypothetical protein